MAEVPRDARGFNIGVHADRVGEEAVALGVRLFRGSPIQRALCTLA